MIKKTTNVPHDALFKQFLTNPETAKDMLEIHLPSHLREICDFSTLRLENCSFIEENLRAHFSDVLYSLKTTQGDGYIYALIEHQSRPEFLMPFRMLKYSIAAMEQHITAGNKFLPIVMPLQFYQGTTSPYPYSMNWLECFEQPEVARQLYTQDFPLVDITVIPDDEIMQHKSIALLELVQKHARRRDILEFIDQFVTLLGQGYNTDKQITSLMYYIFQVGETVNIDELMDKLRLAAPEHEETLMTIAEQLRREGEAKGIQKGRQEGIQLGETKGRQEGIQEGIKKIATNMLLNGIDNQTIINITGLTAEELTLLSH